MKKALLGFLVTMACAAAGFLWGRARREAALKAEAAARAVPPPVVETAPDPLPAELPGELPTESRPADSVPRGLE